MTDAAAAKASYGIAGFYKFFIVVLFCGLIIGLIVRARRAAAGTPKFDAEVEKRVERRIEETIKEDPALAEKYSAYREEDIDEDGIHRAFRDDD